MKRKLLKQIASQWRSNIWLVIELMIILLVMWFLTDLLCQIIAPTFEPRGFDVENCYSITFTRAETDEEEENVQLSTLAESEEIIRRIRAYPGVESMGFSYGGAQPYSGNMSSWGITDVSTTDSIGFGHKPDNPTFRCIRAAHISEGFLKVFRITGPKGETPEELGEALRSHPKAFLATDNFVAGVDSGRKVPDPYSLVGHDFIYGRSKEDNRLTGILKNLKRDDLTPSSTYAMVLYPVSDNAFADIWVDAAIRVRPEAAKDFAQCFRKDMGRFHVGNTYVTDIKPFEALREQRQGDENRAIVKMIFIICFLLVNIFLGLLGTFWYRTRQRTRELAVRLSFGATRISLFRRLISEGLLLMFIAIIPATAIIYGLMVCEIRPQILLALPLTVRWITAVSCIVTMLIALMVVLAIWFPAKMAMKVDPATALHDQ